MLKKDLCALRPPMGWNSWDCYGASVNEAQLLGIGVAIDAAYNGDVNTVKAILQRIFHALAEGPDTCIYSGIADAMESITGVWKETVGTDEDYHEAVDQAQQTVDNTKKSLNWFQRLIQAIKNFFAKLFRFGR